MFLTLVLCLWTSFSVFSHTVIFIPQDNLLPFVLPEDLVANRGLIIDDEVEDLPIESINEDD